jgi:hypothetical protein
LKEKSGVLVAGGGGGSSFGLAGWFGFDKRKVCETAQAQPNGIAWKYIKRAFFSVVCTVVVVALALSPLSLAFYTNPSLLDWIWIWIPQQQNTLKTIPVFCKICIYN